MSQWVEKDELLMKLVDEFGPRWTEIVKHLPGNTTVSAARNRYIRMQARPRVQKCSRCGKSRKGHIYSQCVPLHKFVFPVTTRMSTRISESVHQKEVDIETVEDFELDEDFENMLRSFVP